MDQWYKPGGCREKLIKCQEHAQELDPDWIGNVPSVSQCFVDYEENCTTVKSSAMEIEVGFPSQTPPSRTFSSSSI